MKAKILIIAGLGLGISTVALGDEIQFTTLPQAVQTTVVRQTKIPDYSRVTRVYRDQNGMYEVTVRGNTNNEILYVQPSGSLVREQTVALTAPVTTGQVVTNTTVEEPTVDTFVRDLDQSRFQLVEKKGIKEVYLDKLTGQRWKVEVRPVAKD
jgi:hypothetical protein